MCLPRIEARVGSVETSGIGAVQQRRLVFHKKSIDGSAKANAMFVDSKSEAVWGVLYRLRASQKGKLDEFEFLGTGYDQIEVDVRQGTNIITAWMYVARSEAIDSNLAPYDWYHNLILHGAFHHRLPAHYIKFLRSIRTIDDPDRKRHAQNSQLLK